MNRAQEICEKLKIDYSQILNIYPYGSRVYGTASQDSDEDFVIVYKTSLLPSGAFRDNAISSEDRKIQGTCFSRSGFIDAINTYYITALECIFLPEEKIIQQKMVFKMTKFFEKEFISKIIKTASLSWYHGMQAEKSHNVDQAKKNIFHAIRILYFGLQIKKNLRIMDYTVANHLKKQIMEDDKFKSKKYYALFMTLSNKMK